MNRIATLAPLPDTFRAQHYCGLLVSVCETALLIPGSRDVGKVERARIVPPQPTPLIVMIGTSVSEMFVFIF
jgi:hypothetical protein